jgi:hypothetical protein
VPYRKPHMTLKWFQKPLVVLKIVLKTPYDMKIFADSSNEGWTLEKIYQRERREAEIELLSSFWLKKIISKCVIEASKILIFIFLPKKAA